MPTSPVTIPLRQAAFGEAPAVVARFAGMTATAGLRGPRRHGPAPQARRKWPWQEVGVADEHPGDLTHFDASGRARMVDVGSKDETTRTAVATGRVEMQPETIQLVREGRIHNYLRMLWGKKMLEWTASPRDSLDVMIELNNRYALDGRNPNSYSGIFWCLGRFDRAWFERPIFGKIRYMSSDSTFRKFKMQAYMARWGATQAAQRSLF